jgi:glycosyltransferase involved in cell wall biosynthesis
VRVLTVGNIYPPHHFGGYEQVWQSAVAHLRDQGHEVRVLCTGYRHEGVPDGDEPGVDRSLGWYWRDHDFVRIAVRDRVRLERRNHRALRRHLNDLRPDVVAFWSMGGMSHSLIEAVRRAGLPAAFFAHDVWLGYGRATDQWTRIFQGPRRGLAAPLAERALGIPARVDYGRAGRYVFVSDFVRRRVAELGLGIADTAVAHSGIDPLFLSPAPRPDWAWRLLHVGRLHPDKGIQDAVAALALLPEQATLTFAGTWDPREESSLGAQIADLGVGDRVTLLGHRTHEQIAGLYRSHDAVLFPVRWEEPWGLVPLEAMGCGCPVVATGRGGSGEYLRDGENCLLVPAARPDALANAVRRLAGDPQLRAALVAGGADTAPRHTEPIFNAAVERHLREVATGRPAA